MTPKEYGELCALHAQGDIDGKATTEYFWDEAWSALSKDQPPFTLKDAQIHKWRAIDPLQEYKEAFEAGKKIQYLSCDGSWYDNPIPDWSFRPNEYRIVEEHKTVRLLPFAFQAPYGKFLIGYHPDLETAKQCTESHAIKVYPVNPDGSIDAEVRS
jgi:hypothetical protein